MVIKNTYNKVGWISEWSARVMSWVIIAITAIIVYEVVMRYVFNAPTTWVSDISGMLLAIYIAMAFTYVHYKRGHVRVDLFYSKFSPKGKLIIDVVFTLIFFFPLFLMLTNIFVQDAWHAYQFKEVAVSTWFPLTWPFKSVVALGFCLLSLQGIATFLKDVVALTKGGKEPW